MVNIGLSPVIDSEVTPTHLETHLTCSVPSGWVYIKANDPGQDNFRLARVIRSDGREIRVSDNAWTTHRTIRLVGQSPYRENLLHIFDNNSTGSYTLVYEEIAPDVTPPTSSVSPLPAEQASTIFTVCWSGEDNAGGSGLKDFDIYVSDNGGAWKPWLTGVTIRCASYVGESGHSYGFYSIARDVAGNVEGAPAGPDATTSTPDTILPSAEFVTGNFTTNGYTFTVRYTDNRAINVSQIDSCDIRVTGPNGFDQSAVFVSVNTNGVNTATAKYSIAAPGGSWDSSDNGNYTLYVEPNQVGDTAGNFVPAGVLRTFTITESSASDFTLVSYNVVSTNRVGRTIFDYVFTVTLRNNGQRLASGVKFELFNAPSNMTILDSNVVFDQISAGQSAVSQGTLKVRIDRSGTTDLYSIPWRVTFVPGKLLGDFTGDGRVDFEDLAILAGQWLKPPGVPSADIAPVGGDGIVNFLDFSVLAENWAE